MPDANAPFRLMRTDLVNKYIHRLPKNYNLPNIMLTTYFVYYKEKITFLPITFKPRERNQLPQPKKNHQNRMAGNQRLHTLKKSM